MQEYTFGQIIDMLQPGQVAVSEDGLKISCLSTGDIFFGNGDYPSTSSHNRNRKWKIEPQEITAIEAMQRIIDGKKVGHYDVGQVVIVIDKNSTVFLGCLTTGKWYAID